MAKKLLAKIQKNEDGTVTTTSYTPPKPKTKAKIFYDHNNLVYIQDDYGVYRKVGYLNGFKSDDQGDPVPNISYYDSFFEPKNKKERMKMKAGESYRNKDGNKVDLIEILEKKKE